MYIIGTTEFALAIRFHLHLIVGVYMTEKVIKIMSYISDLSLFPLVPWVNVIVDSFLVELSRKGS